MSIHRFVPITLLSLAPLLWSSALLAGSHGWSYSDHDAGSYVPRNGLFAEAIPSAGYYYSEVTFWFDDRNLASIEDYNNGGDNPGDACDSSKAYLTVDMTSVPDGIDTLHAGDGMVVTNLPDAKIDVEDDFWESTFGINEESEVVVLGTLRAGAYLMRTYWLDRRTGAASDGGAIQVQFAMSAEGSPDYNNCITSSRVQIVNPYGTSRGSL
ncbi:hypothetical protein [Sorangium sp. So ce1389]|uniref:hypothetical protein n=1 Tax=Sorangium sp. So ce1389 TaxID=3133336 RepID=UPI003F5DCEE1